VIEDIREIGPPQLTREEVGAFLKLHMRRSALVQELFHPKPMKLIATTLSAVVIALFVARGDATGPMCSLDRRGFELLISLRMQNYESTGDSWSGRATKWRNEISSNIGAGRATASLDGAFARYGRYCGEKDDFMAGLTIGEWIGLALRPAP
jgi:hypothetical protein